MTESAADSNRSQAIKAIALILSGLTFVIFGIFSIDLAWKEKDAVKSYFEAIPGEQESLKNLGAQLVEQDQLAFKEINIEQGGDLWMQEAKSDYPERFIVSPGWLGLVARNKEIPDFQKEKLVKRAEEGPLSTKDAAYWLYEASLAAKSKGAYDAQQIGVQVLKDSIR